MLLIAVRPGQEVLSTITAELEHRGVRTGAIVSLVGAVDSCCMSTMPRADACSDVLREYHEPFELTGNGEVKDGKPHIHCVLGTSEGTALAGHLHWARVETWFVNAYIEPLTDSA